MDHLKKQVKFAQFYPRIFALLFDLMVLTFLFMPVGLFFENKLYGDSQTPMSVLTKALEHHGDSTKSWTEIVRSPEVMDKIMTAENISNTKFLTIVQIAFATSFFLIFSIFRQATPGKMLFRLRIVDADTFEAPKLWQHIARTLAYVISALPCGFGFFRMIWNKRKQTWHDAIAGTVVIQY
jgi:hypothetical protein